MASARRFGYSPIVRPQTVVFVEPPYVCWDRQMDRVREGEEKIPGHRARSTLAAVARERGYRVHIVDGKRTGTPVEEVAARGRGARPDHVGISRDDHLDHQRRPHRRRA